MGKLDVLSKCLDYGDRSFDNENIILLHPKLLTICTLEGVKLEGLEKNLLSKIQCV